MPMAEAVFHVHVADRVHYACRLLRKAVAAEARVVVLGDAEILRDLDAALWTFSQIDFIAHAWSDAPAAVRDASPVVLARDAAAAHGRPVVVNLGWEAVADAGSHERLIEIVDGTVEALAQARVRWRAYQSLGMNPVRHDATATAE